MRDGLVFRSMLMGGSGTTELAWLCDVETGSIFRVHTTNTPQTAAQYYNYSNQRYNGPGSENNTILIRWHRNSITKELSLIMVGQSDGTQTVGPIRIAITNLNASAYVSVSDDGGETSKNGSTINSTLMWSADKTDGFAVSGIDAQVIPNLVITFDTPYPTMRLKIQTSPNVFSYIRQDKSMTFTFKATDTDPCARYEYPPASAYIVNTAEERNAAISAANAPPTPEQVFNNWGRYAGPNWYPSGTPPQGEAASWSYDSATNRIRCTVNSSNYIGFVSPETLSYYDLTTRIGSGNSDDDLIGVVIAFTVNNGAPSALCAVRTNGGSIGGRAWAIIEIVNNNQTILVNGNDLAPTTHQNGPGGGGWAASGTTVVRVKRNNRTITATCSQFASDTLDPNTTITYTIPEGSIYDAPRAYGYMCQSQNDSFYDMLNFQGGLDASTVYDITVNPPRVYEYNGSAWVVNPNRSVFTELGQPRTMTNPSTGKKYRLDNNQVTILP